MDRQPPSVDFAAIGHQADWDQVSRLVAALRDPSATLSLVEMQETFRWVPPRVLMRARIHSILQGRSVCGAYVETFIDPGELGVAHLKRNLSKVRAAIDCATRHGARVTTLGGFSSIVLEGRAAPGPMGSGGVLTTGNSLTVYLAMRGVEQAALALGLDLGGATLGIIGATGDIGSACVRVLGPRVRRVLLHARSQRGLQALHEDCESSGVRTEVAEDLAEVMRSSQLILCAASMAQPEIDLSCTLPGTLVCDIGYPKNVVEAGGAHVFWGGLGEVTGGWEVEAGVGASFYEFGVPNVLHGCLLEAAVLALDERYEPYSKGRGLISAEQVYQIGAIAERHGIRVAPLMNHQGLWAVGDDQGRVSCRS